jgi:MoaA/NifB/PqqE/SkfB family radical SAM enzyme
MITLDKSIGANFCYAPWTNIHINPQGKYKVCCAASEVLGDLRSESINELVKSTKLTDLKNDLLNNEPNLNCTICRRQELNSSSSERSWYDNIAQNKPINLNSLNDYNVQNLDIRWSTTCNLSCVYCDAEASSQWAELKNLKNERLDYTTTLPDILEFIQKNKNTIRNLGLLGGEPLLQKENAHLLDVIDNDVNINVITNLSVPLEKNKIFHKLIEKNRVVWDVSFETIEEKFEYVRHGSSWELIVNNIRFLQNLIKDRPGHIIGITGQICVYNALDLSTVCKYFVDNNFPQPRWNELTYPSVLSVASLPNRFIKQSIIELQKSAEFVHWHRQKQMLNELAKNLNLLDNQINNCSELIAWHQKQETEYWPKFKYKFADLWPEYS